MQIETCFVYKIEDEKIIDDILCRVICMSQNSYSYKKDDTEIAETFNILYCFNEKTGEVSAPKLEDVLIKSYYDTQTKSTVNISGAIKRI